MWFFSVKCVQQYSNCKILLYPPLFSKPCVPPPFSSHQALLFSVSSKCKIWAVGWRVLLFLHVSTFYDNDDHTYQVVIMIMKIIVTFSHSESKSPETQAKQMSSMFKASCSAKVAFTWFIIDGMLVQTVSTLFSSMIAGKPSFEEPLTCILNIITIIITNILNHHHRALSPQLSCPLSSL